MNLKNKTLEDWLKKQKKEKFPTYGESNYYNRYESIKEYLNNKVHKHVTGFASIKDGGYLTDHGPGHIKNVIRKATELVKVPKFELTPYEVYLLLTAIHFHDVGHIKEGRYQHEINAAKVMKDLEMLMGSENIEIWYINQLVQAHGGKNISGNKDKIGELPEEVTILDFPVRVQLLAALLRFADELSDDSSRCARYLLENGQIPLSSEIYHYYAKTLHSVKVDHDAKFIELHFSLDKENVSKKYGKDQVMEYLLDEIYKRTKKTYVECLYCMRFIPSILHIRSIKVNIEFIEKIAELDSEDSWKSFKEPIKYELTERGYPDFGDKDIFSLCPELFTKDGEKLTGSKLKELVEKNSKKRRKLCLTKL